MMKFLLPIVTVFICCYLGSILLATTEGESCSMAYMWPNYFSLRRIASMRHAYDVYLYKEGRHNFVDARKVQLLGYKGLISYHAVCFRSYLSNSSQDYVLRSVSQTLHCQQRLVGQRSFCMGVMAATSR